MRGIQKQKLSIQLILGCVLLLAFTRNAQEMNPQHFRHPETQLSTAILSLKSWGWGWRVATLRLRKNSYLWKRCWNKGLVSEKNLHSSRCSDSLLSARLIVQEESSERVQTLGRTDQSHSKLTLRFIRCKKWKLWMTLDPLQHPLLSGLNKSNVFICKCLNGGKALNLFPSNTVYLATKNKTFRNWNDKQTAWTFKQHFTA